MTSYTDLTLKIYIFFFTFEQRKKGTNYKNDNIIKSPQSINIELYTHQLRSEKAVCRSSLHKIVVLKIQRKVHLLESLVKIYAEILQNFRRRSLL